MDWILKVIQLFLGKQSVKDRQNLKNSNEIEKLEVKPQLSSARRRINAQGLALIKEYEGLKLKAYYCPAGVLTIGYGSTGPHVKEGMVISEKEADELLQKDLERFEQGVHDLVQIPITENQFSALVSFAFNVGLGNLRRSTLLRKLNTRDYEGASKEFERWNKAGGVVLMGLVRRRAAEKELFLST